MDHHADGGKVDNGFTRGRKPLIVLAQAPVATELGQGTLHNPMLGQHDKALHIVAALDDLQRVAPPRAEQVDQLQKPPPLSRRQNTSKYCLKTMAPPL